MNVNEILYLPVKREGLSIGPDEFDCKHRYRTLDGEEVASSFKAKSKEELLERQKPEIPDMLDALLYGYTVADTEKVWFPVKKCFHDSGVQALQSTLDYINFLESEKSRCYKELEDNEACIDRLKQSNIELTQKVVDVMWKDMRRVAKAQLSRRKYGVKIG
ncbi:TPA: hypothetical protein ACINQE_000166 [Streptococcus agalactiae]|uniref:hypothetical protein n=1 Tax=Streptococcus agalactiae TaxID=1311 RepID=UPI0002BB8146|nr:hypothetical protein [Streptococcus agalactiae]EPV11940.1 hypothetical protein SAG0330_04180 [Streptococcus agalactiae GB00561]CFQ77866.1 Uncharacterised protein [Streptococcus agalactiae]CNK15721.1 Uncharacterised protein [Streptococcus agalactiae]CQJ46299.1 Uncharacterised protein [Streptococcus agalactiae]